jgi:large subunit ribosomal protein L17
MKTIMGSLIMREKITTTLAKIKNHIDQLVNKGKRAESDKDRRQAELRLLRQKLSLEATKKISSDFVKRFETRKSGYTRITKLERRQGDGAEMAVIEFVS